MKYTVKPRSSGGYGQFSVIAADEREALIVATRLLEHGCGVEILGYPEDGVAYEFAELERAVLRREPAQGCLETST